MSSDIERSQERDMDITLFQDNARISIEGPKEVASNHPTIRQSPELIVRETDLQINIMSGGTNSPSKYTEFKPQDALIQELEKQFPITPRDSDAFLEQEDEMPLNIHLRAGSF